MQLRPNQVVPLMGQDWIRWTRVPNSGLLFQKFEMVYTPENALWTRYIPALVLMVIAIFLIRGLRSSAANQVSKLVVAGISIFWFSSFSNVLSHFLSVFVDDTVTAQFWPGSKFYVFNVADLGITLGMAAVFFAIVRIAMVQTRETAADSVTAVRASL